MELGRLMWPPAMLLVLVTSVLLITSSCYGCWETERAALLHLRDSLNHPNGGSLRSWGTHPNCCLWEGVECNSTTNRVMNLILNDTRDGRLPLWYLNCSLFLPFQDLRALYLASNQIGGCMDNEGFNKLSGLKNLAVLDLSQNLFRDTDALLSLSEISSLTSLRLRFFRDFHMSAVDYRSFRNLWTLKNLEFLDLSSNQLGNGIIPYLVALTSLKTLDLSFNQLEGTLHTPGVEEYELLKLGNLEVLDLQYNQLDTKVFSSLRRLPSLKILYLNGNSFNGSLLTADISALRNLEELHLGNNDIDEFISSKEMTSLSKLKVLELSYMKVRSWHLLQLSMAFPLIKSLDLSRNILFSQSMSCSGFEGFKHLEELYLDQSFLDKSFLENIREPNSIKVLSLSESNLIGLLPSKGWCELKNLQELNLAVNYLQGTLPSCLRNLTSLRVLDISENLLTGDIAATSLPNLSLLEFLSISDNNFRIPISFSPFMNNSKLRVLVANNNELISESAFQAPPPRLQLYLFSSTDMSMEKLPQFLYSQNYLRVLDLSYNNLTGMFPSWLMRNNSRLEILRLGNNLFIGSLTLPLLPNPNLLLLDVSKNNMGGRVPQNFGLVFPSLRFLILDENTFEVDHLESLSLEHLSLSNNELVGKMPSSLGKITTLRYLDLSNNELSGEVPGELILGLPLETLKLSNNNLEGELHPMLIGFLESKDIRVLHLDGNNFEGEIQDYPPTISSSGLASFDIRNNNLSGGLPRWISTFFSDMVVLDMSYNHFEGPIPEEFCQLQMLSYLDISSNYLSGSVPSCFYSISSLWHIHLGQNQLEGHLTFAFYGRSSLVTLDLSNNHLSGRISTEINNFSEMSVLLLNGNSFEGEIPIQLCQMKRLSLVDLSQNNLSGHLPQCLSNLSFEALDIKSVIGIGIGIAMAIPNDGPILDIKMTRLWNGYVSNIWFHYVTRLSDHVEELVKFSTKRNSYGYKGKILNLMSGLDLSSNHFSGQIPLNIGNLSKIRALNLSHNNFTGSIPSSFSNLRLTESLDLSHNHLTGEIPHELIDLNELAIFSVAFNNLSGPIPEQKGQFGTFDETSYQGNLLLCGAPILISCNKMEPPSRVPINKDGEVMDSFFDINFYASFIVSYVITISVGVAVLLINPYWRQLWFHFIEVFITTIQNLVLDGLLQLRVGLWRNQA